MSIYRKSIYNRKFFFLQNKKYYFIKNMKIYENILLYI